MFTRIPNNIIDNLKLNPYEFQILSIIIRKTDGWCKVEDGISLSQFEKLVSFSKNTIIKTIKSLENMKLISVTRHCDDTKKHFYNVYKIHSRVVQEMNKGSAGDEQGGSAGDEHTKETINKRNYNNKEKINKKEIKYPKELNIEAYEAWCDYKGKNYSAKGKSLSLNKLVKYHHDVQLKMVENSIMNGYKGLFEIKEKEKNQDKLNENIRNAVDKFYG